MRIHGLGGTNQPDGFVAGGVFTWRTAAGETAFHNAYSSWQSSVGLDQQMTGADRANIQAQIDQADAAGVAAMNQAVLQQQAQSAADALKAQQDAALRAAQDAALLQQQNAQLIANQKAAAQLKAQQDAAAAAYAQAQRDAAAAAAAQAAATTAAQKAAADAAARAAALASQQAAAAHSDATVAIAQVSSGQGSAAVDPGFSFVATDSTTGGISPGDTNSLSHSISDTFAHMSPWAWAAIGVGAYLVLKPKSRR